MNRIRFYPYPILLSLLLIAPLFIIAATSNAPPTLINTSLDEANVRRAIETWVRYVTADARPDAVVERMQPYEVDGRVVGYIAHLEGGGFCLAGGNTFLLPVYLYALDGRYDPAEPGFQFVLEEMHGRLTFLESLQAERSPELQVYQPALIQRADLWQTLIQGKVPKSNWAESPDADPSQMELSMTTHWSQGSPYNDQCPLLTSPDVRTVTGCVATALSQVMYYWRWPASGVGSDSVVYNWRARTTWDEEPLATDPKISGGWAGRLEWTTANGGRLRMNGRWDDSVYYAAYFMNTDSTYQAALNALWSRMSTGSATVNANFGASSYNWSVLQDIHSDPVDDGDPEVAEIMLHVGVAMDTYYGIYGSGSDLWRATLVPEVPIVNYFRYDPDLLYANPLDANQVVSEIQWLRPVPVGGSDANGAGHAWVIHGYNKNTSPWQFKMIMGWNDGTDLWWSLDNIPRKLNLNHNSLIRMAPQGVVGFIGGASPGDGSPDAPYQNIEEALSEASDGTTLIFKAGSVNTFSAPMLTINRPLTLKGEEITIQKP